MEAKELRIGNIIFSKETQEIQKIVGITLENPFIDAITFDYTNYEEIEPVPITEEIYQDVRDKLADYGFSYGFDNGKLTLYLSDQWELECEFLHQFQNLYFAVTEKELFD